MPITKSGDLIRDGDWLKITHPSIKDGGDGAIVYVRIKGVNLGSDSNPNVTAHASYSDTITLDVFNNFGQKRQLDWHNCYSFGNGVESNRIGDVFNSMKISPGVKVSTEFEEYKEEHKKYGLIYSGIYNTTSGINNLNQFVQAEKITKDINPTYGSIQKLHTRNTDLTTLCEDKVLRILANKDAVYNADGNLQVTATENVLGQTIPFVGEYGISKNPESFVSEAYRSYFIDKQRGAVLRLSRDGLTPISNHGMKDWFRDNLSTSRVNLLGEDILSSNDNWNHNSTTDNVYIENGTAIIGYYNNDIHSNQAFRIANLRKNNVLDIGKKYKLQFDIISHSGYLEESGGFGGVMINNTPPGGSWSGVGTTGSTIAGNHVIYEWIANRSQLQLFQSQLNNTPGSYGGMTIEEFVGDIRGEDGTTIPYTWFGGSHFYGGIVTIANMVLEEVKIEPKIIGSYDDRQDEYNVTIHSDIPKTVSFKEDVKGWVSFKSFFPESAISCANDYYTIKNGKLWQHHVQGVRRNTFYGVTENSSLNVILNDFPGSVKSFHTLDYEGSESRVEGIKTVEVISDVSLISGSNPGGHPNGYYFYFGTKEEMNAIFGYSWVDGDKIDIKQYRNNILVSTGKIKVIDDPTHGLLGRYDWWPQAPSGGDWQIGDVITTEQQEKTVNHFNSTPKKGWYVSNIETDKEIGNLPEFIEKEGKWFNYIKGINSEINEDTNFGSFDIQGIGIIDSINYERSIMDMIVGSGFGGMNVEATLGSGSDTVTWNVNPQFPIAGHVGSIVDAQRWIEGKEYRLTLEVSNYSGTGFVGVDQGGVSSEAKLDRSGYYEEIFVADGPQPRVFGESGVFSVIIKVIIQEKEREIIFNNINPSLQTGDTLYYETPSETLGNELIRNGTFDSGTGNWQKREESSQNTTLNPQSNIPWVWDNGTVSATSALPRTHPYTTNPDMLLQRLPSITATPGFLTPWDGNTYRVSFEISDWVSGKIRVSLYGYDFFASIPPSEIASGNGIYTYDLVVSETITHPYVLVNLLPLSAGGITYNTQPHIRLEVYDSPFTGRIDNVSIKEVFTGDVLGFTRLEADNAQEIGVVSSIVNNTVTAPGTNLTYKKGDYVFFVKNQAINTSSLLGYYADVKLENSSTDKVEIFSINSEVTESSK